MQPEGGKVELNPQAVKEFISRLFEPTRVFIARMDAVIVWLFPFVSLQPKTVQPIEHGVIISAAGRILWFVDRVDLWNNHWLSRCVVRTKVVSQVGVNDIKIISEPKYSPLPGGERKSKRASQPSPGGRGRTQRVVHPCGCEFLARSIQSRSTSNLDC